MPLVKWAACCRNNESRSLSTHASMGTLSFWLAKMPLIIDTYCDDWSAPMDSSNTRERNFTLEGFAAARVCTRFKSNMHTSAKRDPRGQPEVSTSGRKLFDSKAQSANACAQQIARGEDWVTDSTIPMTAPLPISIPLPQAGLPPRVCCLRRPAAGAATHR